MRLMLLLISFILPSAAFAAEICLSADERVGATYGTAEFVGEPWVYAWTDGSQSAAPGHQIVVRVEDASLVYGVSNSAEMNDGWFDNLGSLTRGLGDGPYTATQLRDGSVRIYGSDCNWWRIRDNLPRIPCPSKDTRQSLSSGHLPAWQTRASSNMFNSSSKVGTTITHWVNNCCLPATVQVVMPLASILGERKSECG